MHIDEDRSLELLGDPAKKIVCIIEHPEHVRAFLILSEGMKARRSVIATSPGACWELERRGIGFQPVERYYDKDTVFRMGMENYSHVEEICEKIDLHLQDKNPVLKQFAFRPVRDSFFSLKVLYDALTMRIMILKGIMDLESPDLVVTFGAWEPEGEKERLENLPFQYFESLYAKVLGLWGWSCRNLHIEIHPEPGPGDGFSSLPMVRDLARSLNRLRAFLPQLRTYMRRFDMKKAVSRVIHALTYLYHGGPHVLRIRYAYNWNYISHLMDDEGLFVRKFQGAGGKKRPSGELPQHIPAELLGNRGIFMGIDLSPAILYHGNRVIQEYLQTYPDLVSRLKETLQRDPPVAVLYGTKDIPSDHIIAHIAQYYHIPVISWQHGAQGASCAPMMLYYEIMNSDLHLCFGDGVRDLYEGDAHRRFSCKLHSVGSYELEELFFDPKPRKVEFDILYATTNYYLNYLYIGGFSHTTFQDNDLWYTQRKILDLLGKSGRKTAFKLHPGQYQEKHLREYLGVKGYSNITVFKNERAFTDLALHAQVVILDVQSTTLLQAVAAKKPVFLLTRHAKLTGNAMSALVKRAYCAETLDDFVTLIERYLERDPELPHPDPTNSEFLERYGIQKPDGKVLERVLSILNSLRNKEEEKRNEPVLE